MDNICAITLYYEFYLPQIISYDIDSYPTYNLVLFLFFLEIHDKFNVLQKMHFPIETGHA